MSKKDIIHKFIQSKKHKKKTRLNKDTAFSHTLGSQVLKNHVDITIDNLKHNTPSKLTSKLKDAGFKKIMTEVNSNHTTSGAVFSHIIHSKLIGVLDYVINNIILNSKLVFWSLLIFFIVNTIYYSICTLYHYTYLEIVAGLLFIVSFLLGCAIQIALLLTNKR